MMIRGHLRWSVATVILASCLEERSDVCNGVLDVGEECDDGNPIDGDGCDCTARVIPPAPVDEDDGGLFVIEDDGAWCWFQDDRAILEGDRLVVGSVSHGGDIQVASYDLAARTSGGRTHAVQFRRFERDDHDAPSLLVHPDGRITAFYTKHDGFPELYRRTTIAPGDLTSWTPERQIKHHFYITYSNPFLLADEGREYVFFRGRSLDPSFMVSDDDGETWSAPAAIMDAGSQRPYVKYASDGRGTIHLFYTDGHPNEFLHNSVYHLAYRGGALHRSDGTQVAAMTPGHDVGISPARGTKVYDGTALPGGQAWTWDATIDDDGHPVVVFSTYPDPARPFFDHRYRYARWDGEQWRVSTIGHGGTGIYYVEGYYSGGITIVPGDPDTVYFASNVRPEDGEPAATTTFELYRGVTGDGGAHWTITPVTRTSAIDNLRPVVPAGRPEGTTLVWMQGTYDTYLDYDTRIVGLVGDADAEVVTPAPVDLPLVAVARFDLNATLHGPATPTAPGYVAAIPEGGTAIATSASVTLTVGNVTGSRDAAWEDALYRDLVLNSRDGYGEGGKLTVTLGGLAPQRDYVVRIHGHDPVTDYLHATLWFRAGHGDLIIDGNDDFLGGHRNVNDVNRGAGATDFLLTSDGDGAIRLVARGVDNFGGDNTAVLNGVEVFERPETQPLARFDIDARPDRGTAPDYTPIWFDDARRWRGSAADHGVSVTVWTDRIDSLRERDRDDLLRSDFVFGRDQVVVDVDGLEVGRAYEIVVHSVDLTNNLYAATRWRVEEPDRTPVIVRGFQINARSEGPSGSFTFYHVASSPSLRLRGTDVMTSLSTDPSLVVLNGIEVRSVLP